MGEGAHLVMPPGLREGRVRTQVQVDLRKMGD